MPSMGEATLRESSTAITAAPSTVITVVIISVTRTVDTVASSGVRVASMAISRSGVLLSIR